MAILDVFVDIPFLTTSEYEGKLASIGTSLFEGGEQGVVEGLTPGTGSLGIVGQPAIISQTADMLLVLFDIWATIYSPLLVEFDITSFPFVVNPLIVEFDIAVNDGVPLVVTFDIFVEALINARLYNDIQGPVAEVDLS